MVLFDLARWRVAALPLRRGNPLPAACKYDSSRKHTHFGLDIVTLIENLLKLKLASSKAVVYIPMSSSTDLTSPTAAASISVEQMKRELLAGLNHELRTPLTGILGMLDLLSETTLDEEQQDYVASSRACAEALLESITNSIEFSSLNNGASPRSEFAFRPAEMLRSVVSAHELKARAKGLDIQLVMDRQLPEIAVADAHRIRQVLDILLSNALKFTVRGDIEVLASASPEGEVIRFMTSVRDSGPGISDERLPHLFSGTPPVGSASHCDPETGLRVGLPLAHQLAESLDGSLEVESTSVQGSVFTFSVPLSAAPVPVAKPGAVLPAGEAPPRILIVEDNSVAQRFLSTLLTRRGFNVTIAESGYIALDLLEKEAYDAILMDLQMPGIDGIETTRRLRELPNGAQVPVVACTANATWEVREACLAATMNDFLGKPVSSAELVSVLTRHLAAYAGKLSASPPAAS